jgi:signal transduction histidine kinase
MGLFGVSVLLLLGFVYWATGAYMAQQTNATIEAEIAGLAERYRQSGLAGLTALIAERLSRKPAGSSIYLLADQDFTPLIGNLDRWPRVPKTDDGWLSFRLGDCSGSNGTVHWARARSFRLRGGFHLLVGRDLHELEQIQGLIARTVIWGLVITVVLALVGGVMMSRSVVRRIEVINETGREIMSGDLSRRIPTQGTGDDFDQLIDNLNRMLDQIQTLMEDVRRVSDNIAHDLKTPLARLRNRLEVLKFQRSAFQSDQETVNEAIADADGLLSTFNALLRIARIESERRRDAFQTVGLEPLLQDVIELYEPLAEAKTQRLERDFTLEVLVCGDRNLLFQAVANVLDNAIKYTPHGGAIGVSLETNDKGPKITIADSGPGIPEEARQKVFQRFFRLEQSRTTRGNGLGLSLVAAVAKVHHAELYLADNNPGLKVVFQFLNNIKGKPS